MTSEYTPSPPHLRSNFGLITKIETDPASPSFGKIEVVVLSVDEMYQNNRRHHCYIFPGGGMTPGECDRANLLRELSEEVSASQRVLKVNPMSAKMVLMVEKPSDSGGTMTQNFWYVPTNDNIVLRDSSEATLMESDGDELGQPFWLDIGEMIAERDHFRMTHVAAACIFVHKLMDPGRAVGTFGLTVEISNAVRKQYGSKLAPYFRKTHFFLKRLRYCHDRKTYTSTLFFYNRALNKIRDAGNGVFPRRNGTENNSTRSNRDIKKIRQLLPDNSQ